MGHFADEGEEGYEEGQGRGSLSWTGTVLLAPIERTQLDACASGVQRRSGQTREGTEAARKRAGGEASACGSRNDSRARAFAFA
eukprot:3436734-Pleurochrysis_carterae.AAC.4